MSSGAVTEAMSAGPPVSGSRRCLSRTVQICNCSAECLIVGSLFWLFRWNGNAAPQRWGTSRVCGFNILSHPTLCGSASKVSHWILYAWANWLNLLLTLMTFFSGGKATMSNYICSAVFERRVLVFYFERTEHFRTRLQPKGSFPPVSSASYLKKEKRGKKEINIPEIKLTFVCRKDDIIIRAGISTSSSQLEFAHSNGDLQL